MAEPIREPVLGPGLRALERWLRVPPAPDPPAGSAESVRRFRAAPGYFRYRVLGWVVKQLGAVWGLAVGFTVIENVPEFPFSSLLLYAEAVGVAGFVLQLPFTFLLLRLDFRYRWYLVTDRGLRIREGVLQVREQTMSFANVQNLSTEQGPLQRLFGIADLKVRTAGGGGKSEGEPGEAGKKDLHLGYFRGVDDAEGIRDLILARLRGLRAAGLGDPDEPVAPAMRAGAPASDRGPATVMDAARELLAEARALRAARGRTGPPGLQGRSA
ncbi:MAG TPA: PH domain-containing protein [Thermoanaerobaculia bacterium]|nr:PH domain-containing protein [Thermoanaerobaculia bacterium]